MLARDKTATLLMALALLVVALLAALVIWPQGDLWIAHFFYREDQGFFWRDAPALHVLTSIATTGAWVLALAIAGIAGWCAMQSRNVAGITAKGWLFLFFTLVIGPGLIANALFKENWGRARPREISEFGGTARFTPPLLISDQCSANCSFVAGDASFGFALPAFAYVVPRRRRLVFVSGIGLGLVFGLARVIVGAHFVSDVIFAAVFMLLTAAGLHALMYGKRMTAACWREFLGLKSA